MLPRDLALGVLEVAPDEMRVLGSTASLPASSACPGEGTPVHRFHGHVRVRVAGMSVISVLAMMRLPETRDVDVRR